MHTTRPISWFNRVLLTVLVAGAVWCAVTGVWLLAVVLAAAVAYLGLSIARARRGSGSDRSRVNAVQPFDERERDASTRALALVGQTSIIALMSIFIAQAATRDGRVDPVVAGVLIVLAAVWGVGIQVAVRRG
ncbi:hypothetical protein [uncultured Phycicoccus sp.]|uniref:hypothetical protein n=1 Tax=uncultured Phycicoccus sp. TaxID=661422 RepID=UPI00262DEBA8|nr:hypothetical protein [uncultured Phycicoccus sp.]